MFYAIHPLSATIESNVQVPVTMLPST